MCVLLSLDFLIYIFFPCADPPLHPNHTHTLISAGMHEGFRCIKPHEENAMHQRLAIKRVPFPSIASITLDLLATSINQPVNVRHRAPAQVTCLDDRAKKVFITGIRHASAITQWEIVWNPWGKCNLIQFCISNQRFI